LKTYYSFFCLEHSHRVFFAPYVFCALRSVTPPHGCRHLFFLPQEGPPSCFRGTLLVQPPEFPPPPASLLFKFPPPPRLFTGGPPPFPLGGLINAFTFFSQNLSFSLEGSFFCVLVGHCHFNNLCGGFPLLPPLHGRSPGNHSFGSAQPSPSCSSGVYM